MIYRPPLQISTILAELQRKHAAAYGENAGAAWRDQIDGVCLNEDDCTQGRVGCIRLTDGTRITADDTGHDLHWLIGYLQARVKWLPCWVGYDEPGQNPGKLPPNAVADFWQNMAATLH